LPVGSGVVTGGRTLKIASLFLGAFIVAGVSAAEITVHAAASLTDALKEIGPTFEKQSGDTLRFNFGASSTLARQLEEGAPGDLFLSADEAKMDRLEKKGFLVPGTRRSLLSNRLVIIVPADAPQIPKSAADLTRPQYKKITLAEPATVPAGIYTREYLQRIGIWDALKEKLVPTENVRGALAAVEGGNVEAGFVYKTDALVSRKVKIALEISSDEGPKISYPLAVLKSSKDEERAKKFADYLRGPAARETFMKFGFSFAP
jgi:molybdate transport system substrate-binding protein